MYAARFLGFIPVALKLAPWEGTEPTNGVVLTADEEIREEIKVYQALSGSPTSSCIPRLISHGYLCSSHQGRRRYLAISLLKGLSMRKAAMQLSSLEDAILLSRQAFSSLLLFHKSGAAHHSVSSRNLLVDSSLKVWLLDLASAEVGASQRAMRDDFNSMARALFSSLEGMGCLSKSEVEEAVQRGQDVYEEGMLKSKTS